MLKTHQPDWPGRRRLDRPAFAPAGKTAWFGQHGLPRQPR